MPASRIAYALGDLKAEVDRLFPDGGDHLREIEIRTDLVTFEAVERALVNHFGGALVGDRRPGDDLAGVARAVKVSGIRLVGMSPAKDAPEEIPTFHGFMFVGEDDE